jgi:hypothetical protein
MLYGGRPPEGPERKLSVSTRVESGSERFVTLGELLSLSQRKSPRPGRGKLEIHYRVWIEVTIIASLARGHLRQNVCVDRLGRPKIWWASHLAINKVLVPRNVRFRVAKFMNEP